MQKGNFTYYNFTSKHFIPKMVGLPEELIFKNRKLVECRKLVKYFMTSFHINNDNRFILKNIKVRVVRSCLKQSR